MTDLQHTSAEWVRVYRARGWTPIPLKYQDKAPLLTDWQTRPFEDDRIDQTFTPERNVGLNLGPASRNVVDVDLDSPEAVMMAPRILPETGAIFGRLSKPKSHYLYEIDPNDTVRRIIYEDPEGGVLLEIRGEGHQTMIPPSFHPHGEQTEWDTFEDPGTETLGNLEARAGLLATIAMLGRHWDDWQHKHHMTVLALSGGLFRAGYTTEQVLNLVEAVCLVGNDNDWQDRKKAVESTAEKFESGEDIVGFTRLAETIGEQYVRRIFKWLNIKTSADEIPTTDHGNALRLVRDFGHVLRFVPDWQHWAIWDSTRWNPDKAERVYQYARKLPEEIAKEAAKTTNEDRRTALAKWAVRSQDVGRMNAVLRVAKTDDAFIVDSTETDSDPWLFNVLNGTIDLRTGGLKTHDPKDLITKRADVVYDPSAKAPLWEQYLLDVMDGNVSLVAFLKRLVGYSMTGLTIEQVFTLLWGPPGTGKTTFVETIRAVFGDYATNAEASTFMAKKQSGRATPELARLQGARVVTAAETEDGQRMAISLVKHLSGGDRMTASNLYAAPFEFDPVMKLWIMTNHKPRIPADEEGIWERLIFVPFTVQFRNKPTRIKDLKERLIAEYPGILTWAVEGCLEWRQNGLQKPLEVTEAIDNYRNESDEMGDFLDEMTELIPMEKVLSSVLYAAYTRWASDRGFRPVNIRKFGSKLEARGFEKVRKPEGMVWTGLKLTTATITVIDDLPGSRRDARTTFGRPTGD